MIVKWDIVCKPKELRGLGVRDIRAVNISLLTKWRWRLLEDDDAIWKKVLKSKYGESVAGSDKAYRMWGSYEFLARYLEAREVLISAVLSEASDRWGWLYNGGGDFTVKSTYRKIWAEVFYWLRLDFSLPHNLLTILYSLQGMTMKKSMKQGLTMIWMAVVWAIWKMRNSFIFENGLAQAEKVVEDVKLWSWKWWLSRVKPSAICLLYEWTSEPLLCLER
ncbi:hypothetical protein TSUD_391750 [Trifolium subterraneum]|uniref:Reverse transcriptase zinc-binding domain-containing protein n=1 Tax=Trifolium subterraneum TaxID=3900 RepID=A0A2Z6NH18_TRISU|nr:hypothetical protein TSUD_391750 [Trifolium subterraneum]